MKTLVLLILVCLCCSLLTPAVKAHGVPAPDFEGASYSKQYCAGLIGNSLAFAFASGVSVAVPALSAGFLAASLLLAIAAVSVC